jgi:hypothetical protein
MITLPKIMQVNALSSGATGLLMVVLSKTIAALFGVEITQPFTFVGLFLIVFALMVFIISIKKPINPQWVRVVILLDSLWVVGSIIALFALSSTVTTIGLVLIAGIALWVAAMAFFQNKGLKQA